MKKPVTAKVTGAVAVLVVLTSLSACSDSSSDGSQDPSQVKVAFACATPTTNPFFAPFEQGAKDAAGEMGIDLNYTGLAKEVSPEANARVVKAAIDTKPDLLIACNFFPNAVTPLLEQATADGIPVIISGAGAAEALGAGATIATVGQDDRLGGVQAAQKMLDAGVTHPLCVNHVPGNKNVEARCEGFVSAFKDAGIDTKNLSLPTDKYSDTTAQLAAIKGTLAADPEIDGILGLGFQQGSAAVRAVDELGRSGEVTVGTFDLNQKTLDEVEQGKLLFAIWQQPYMQGYLPVLLAAGYERHGFVPSGNVPTGPTLVNKENVAVVSEALDAGLA